SRIATAPTRFLTRRLRDRCGGPGARNPVRVLSFSGPCAVCIDEVILGLSPEIRAIPDRCPECDAVVAGAPAPRRAGRTPPTRRGLFNLFAILSLLLCLASVGLWIRSYWIEDVLRSVSHQSAHYVTCLRGRVLILITPGSQGHRDLGFVYTTAETIGYGYGEP